MNGDLVEIRGAIMSLGRPTNRWIVRFRVATTNLEREFDAYAYDETDAIDLASQWNGGPITVVRTEQRDEVETKPCLWPQCLCRFFWLA